LSLAGLASKAGQGRALPLRPVYDPQAYQQMADVIELC